MLFAIAFRNTWRNRARSIIIMMSVAIGLFSGIAVMALYNGLLRSRVRTVIEAETGHIQLHAANFKKDYDPALFLHNGINVLQQVRSLPDVKTAAPRSITHGMLSTPTGSSGVQVNGVDPETEYRVSKLNRKIIEGQGFSAAKTNEIVVGKKLAGKMKLKPGAKVVLTFTDTTGNIVAGAFRVAAIYQSNNAPLDEKNVYVTMNGLNYLLGIGNQFHEITLLLQKDDNVKQIQNTLQQKLPGYQVESWKEISPETELMVNTIDEYSFIILVIIMLALAFGIVNTMFMAILERTREIGMMIALGMNRVRLFTLILLETLILTLAGAPIGLLIAWALTAYYNKTGLNLSILGKDMLSSFGYSTIVYPEFPWHRLAAVFILVMGTALLSCLLPAAKALRLQPVAALQR
ncbi:ABC transporter permease [Niastella caeni]|uniref:ABC transporter permease n=1 Tax=Niastella caeni TaxID=2569763 RepID=A0A4S8HWE3_9BACT|nr:FtsX-like permease family protein [Niastella caeni]THU39541.1 ABC transporter permease [Niastella caeni]